MKKTTDTPKKPSIFSLLKPYWGMILWLIFFTLISNGLNLAVPKIISDAIDGYTSNTLNLNYTIGLFFVVSVAIFLTTYVQNIIQIYTSERVARELRMRLIGKISEQDYNYVQGVTPSKLLTNLTSDVDSVKGFVAQSISSIISSAFLIVGASVLLLMINWKLALAVLAIVPIIGITFALVFSKVRVLFKASQETVDWLNRVIDESILGSALIRLVNSQAFEYQKFIAANQKAKEIGLKILQLFAGLMPVIALCSNLAVLAILVLGGHFVITGSMTLGDFTAFNSYLTILIFPIIIIGFTSNVISQASASYGRIAEILDTPKKKDPGTLKKSLAGNIEVKNITLKFREKYVLKDVSFTIKPGTRTAIMGPTAAGKTQLFSVMTGLLEATSGTVLYDHRDIHDYDKESFHGQVGMVFQDSSLFNLTLRENIAFSNTIHDEDIKKAIDTAELRDFIEQLPNKLDTIVSERGTSLSGGQKQRIMLARALALNPKILFLDDFTARLDITTEHKILANVRENYPDLTLISITQKIEAVQDYDTIILIMEGEILAMGTHEELMHNSVEYVQIYNSQQSTNNYEL